MALKWPGMAGYIPTGAPPLLTRVPRMEWTENRFKIFWAGDMYVVGYSASDCCEMYDWLLDDIIGKVKILYRGYDNPTNEIVITTKNQVKAGYFTIYFRNKEDAMAFKLRWI